MLEFFRNIGKSAEEKRQEMLNAYLDGELSTREARRFEAELEQDPELRAGLAQLRQIKASIRQLPQVRAPRNYTLDPAVYGPPVREPAQWLPAVRVATALAAFFFILTVALDLFSMPGQAPLFSQSAREAEVADIAAEEVEVEGEAVAVTQVVTEMAEEPVAEEVEMAEDAAELAPPAAAGEAEEASAVEEAEEEMAVEAPQELATGRAEEELDEATTEEQGEALILPEETASPAGGGGLPAQATPSPVEETAARAAEAAATAPPAETDREPAPEQTESLVPSLSLLRIAQIVLGVLLAALLATWALARR
jgi:hypothetical protein